MTRSSVAAPQYRGPGNAGGDDTGQQSYTTSRGISPSTAEVPLWVTACTLFDPPPVDAADKVVTAVTFLMASTIHVHGDLAVKISPTRLALLCGFERPEKAKWLTDYLQRIGFLRIVDGGVNPKTGRRQARRDSKGRPIENELLVFPEPPAHYCGPRTLAEIDALIAEDIAEAELEHERSSRPGSKRSKPRRISIRRREMFGKAAGQSIPPLEGMDSDTHPPCRGDGLRTGKISAGQPTLPLGGMDFDPQPPAKGDGDVSAGQSTPPGGRAYQIDRSSISEREIEDRIEPVPGGTAEPPGTGEDGQQRAEVRELVRALPLRAWHAARGNKEWRLSKFDADVLHAAICAAMDRSGMTLEQARAIGQASISEAKKTPVKYVLTAFGSKLEPWLHRVTPEPEALDPLPLLVAGKRQDEAPPTDLAAATPAPSEPCSECGAAPDAVRLERQITHDDGSVSFCSTCCPPASPNNRA